MKKTVVNIIFLFILLSGGKTLHGQDSSVLTGTIRGILAEAVQNVSVSVEGVVGIPVITDSAGQFSILIPDKNSVLIITPPEEYKSQRLFIGSRTNVEIRLTPVDLRSNQDEAIYFFDFEKERNSISSSSVLDTRSLYESSNISIDEYYNGNISGIWAPGQSGMPGTGSVSFINGIHSLNANTQPLYIVDGQALESTGIMESFVDGFTYNPLVGINPSDITNLTIIKDYAATSIYGMRGSNGVVLIETLKPTEVQTVIDFSFRTGISTSPGQLPQLNSDQYRSFAKEVLMSSGTSEEDYPSLYPGLYVTENDDNSFVYNNNTNWQNTIFRNSRMEDIYFRILGGDEIAKYGLSIGYRNNEGIIDQTSFNRISVRFVGDFNMFQWLKFSVSSNLSSNTSNLKESTIISQTSPIYTGLAKNPLMVPYSFDEDGNQLTVVEDVDEMGVSNPMSVIDGFEAVNRNYRFLTNFKMVGDISRNFKINSAVGINFNSMMENLFMPNLGMELYARDEAYNISKSLSNYLFSISNDNFINYKAEIGKSHAINTNLGLRFNINKYQLDWGIAKNSFENDEYTSLQSGTSNLREMGGDNGNWNRMALYGNLNYTFRDKYSLSLSAAGENSTRIGPNAENVVFVSDIPFGLFYSSGLSWRISNEAFLYQVSWIDDLKLRLSYGKTGNDDIGNYDAFNYFYILHYRNTTGMVPGPKTDESLSFEESYQGNVGLDFATWGNRLRLSVDLFKNRTENLLVNKLQESYLGHTYVPVNSGEIENKGWGIDLSGRIIQNKDFSWDAGINISRFTNNVISIDNNLILNSFEGGEYISMAGDNMLNFYGYEFKGVFKNTGDALVANLVNEDGLPFGAGDAIYSDISGSEGIPDGIIDNFDKTFIGSPIPDFFGGFNSQIKYDKWKLDIMVQGVYGNEVFNYVRFLNEKMTDLSNQSQAIINRWQYEGHETDMPRSLWGDPVGNSAFSSRWIEDGSYLRLKNITLSYKIPDKFLVFRNAEFYVSGINLITLTNYLGYDPEFAFSYSPVELGIDYGLIPFTKTFMIGVKLGL